MTILISLLVGMAIIIAIGIASDAWRLIRDRATGLRRLREMRENDALNRILDGWSRHRG